MGVGVAQTLKARYNLHLISSYVWSSVSYDCSSGKRHPIFIKPRFTWGPIYDVARGVRYIDEKLSKADKSVFLKLSATYRYRKMEILNLSKNYRYRKMHQIWSDKYMKSQSIRN